MEAFALQNREEYSWILVRGVPLSPGCCFAFDAVLYSSPSQVSNSKKFVRILSELNYEIYLFKLSFRNVLFEVYASIRGEEIQPKVIISYKLSFEYSLLYHLKFQYWIKSLAHFTLEDYY